MEVGGVADSGGGPVMACGPVAGVVEDVFLKACGCWPVVEPGLVACACGRSTLGEGVPRRGLVPPRVPELAGMKVEGECDGAAGSSDQPLDQAPTDFVGAGNSGGVVAHGCQRAQPPGCAVRVDPPALERGQLQPAEACGCPLREPGMAGDGCALLDSEDFQAYPGVGRSGAGKRRGPLGQERENLQRQLRMLRLGGGPGRQAE